MKKSKNQQRRKTGAILVKGLGKTRTYSWHVPKFYELAKGIKRARQLHFQYSNSTNPTGQILISGDWRPACGDHELKNEVKRFYLSSLNS